MFYCSHCGIQLEDGANFCNNCGTVTEFGRTQGSAVSQSSDLKEKPVPHMSIEDSLILVEKLQKEYTELEKLNQEIEDNKAILAKPLDTSHRRFSMFRFFWPYLIGAAVAFLLFDMIMVGSSISSPTYDTMIVPGILMIVVPLGIIIAGVVLAIKRAARENEYIAEREVRDIENRKELEKKTESLISKRNVLKQKLDKDEEIVPVALRRSSSMTQLKLLIKSGKAQDYYEAVEILNKL